jgi:uncharacterized phage protein (TIGR01671 family)
MRDIRFRAWNTLKSLMTTTFEQRCIRGSINDELYYITSYQTDLVLMQFAGLRDKNGVNIYEGDIVSDHVGIGQVIYSEQHAAFRVSYGNGQAKWFYDYILNGEKESILIIGNIHQNPDLLEESK